MNPAAPVTRMAIASAAGPPRAHQQKAAADPVDILLDVPADRSSVAGAPSNAKETPDFTPGTRKTERRGLLRPIGVRIAMQDAQGPGLRMRVHVAHRRGERVFS